MRQKKGAWHNMKQITFGNYKSYDDLHLVLTSKTIGSPSVKTSVVDIQGSDGVLDYTDYFGEAKFNNMTHTFEFATIVPSRQFMMLFSAIKDAIHGKKMHIVLDDDPDYYYVGRISVSDFTNEKNIGSVSISCDCEPYKYKKNATVVTQAVSGSATITLQNMRKRTVPTITSNASMSFSFGGRTTTHSAGTFIIPTLELVEGNNTVTVTGTGNVSFTYQEGGF